MTSEQEDLDRIPGVSKGFPKGESIETGRERLSARIRAKMPEDRVDLIVIGASKKDFLQLPHLGPENLDIDKAPFWIPRYSPESGSVHVTRWGKFGENNEKYVIVKKPAYAKVVDLEKVPKAWDAVVLIPQEYPTIEKAMRAQDQIRLDYGVDDGVEQEEVELLMGKIFQLTEVFQHGDEVGVNTLTEIADTTLGIFDALGISGPKDEIKERLITSMQRAAQPDKLGRVNRMVSRILYRSAYLNAVRREVIARLSREKSNRIFWLLFAERQGSRGLLTNAETAIARLGGLGEERGNQILTEELYRQNPRRIYDDDITEIRDMLQEIVETSLKPIRVSPYMEFARLAQALLTSERFRTRAENEKIRKTLVYYNLYSELSKSPASSAEDLIIARRPAAAVDRLRQADSVIKSVLFDPDNLEHTVR